MDVRFGNRTLSFGGPYLTELRESNDILHDVVQLRRRLQDDGYLLIRGLHNRETVLQARSEFLNDLARMGRLDANAPIEQGVIGSQNKSAMWGMGAEDLKETFPHFLEVVNSPSVMKFFDNLLDGPTMTYDYKWPRAVAKNGNTGIHYDIVYMGRGTKNVYTMWTPMDDIPLEKGTLAMCLGSQNFEKIKSTYGQMDVDRDNVATGWFSEDPIEIADNFGGQWATTEFHAGDAIIFGMFMMHASLTNVTDCYRLSSDTRYQRQSEPVDERWVGKKPRGHYAWGKTPQKSVAEAREEWGV